MERGLPIPSFWHHPTAEEEVMIRNRGDHPIYYVLDSLRPEVMREIYFSFRISPDYEGDFKNNFQPDWLYEHKYLVGRDLAAKHLDSSNLAIDLVLAREFRSGTGENARCKCVYISKHPEAVELIPGRDHSALNTFLEKVAEAIELYHSGVRFD